MGTDLRAASRLVWLALILILYDRDSQVVGWVYCFEVYTFLPVVELFFIACSCAFSFNSARVLPLQFALFVKAGSSTLPRRSIQNIGQESTILFQIVDSSW